MSGKIIAIDYDGTIAVNSYPDAGEPNWYIINRAKEEQARGARLILWTCRTDKDLEVAVEACTNWGLRFEAINENPIDRQLLYGNNPRKIYADEYWDDRAMPIKHATWTLNKTGSGTCSNCHFTQANVWDYDNYQQYCGVCGAKMRLED